MIIDWIFNLNLMCSIVGIIFFILAIIFVRRIIDLLSNYETVRKWKILLFLIIIFIAGYIGNMIIFHLHNIDLILLIVGVVYLSGGFFVYLIILRSFETYNKLDELFNQQEKYIDQILKVSQFKTDFMMTMSHELRTPLNSIIGFTDLILDGTYGDLNENQFEFITDIKSSAEYQFEMIKNILDISEIETGKISLNLQEFSLINILNQIETNFIKIIDEIGLKLIWQGVNVDTKIVADPTKFKDLITELIDNAVKFTTKGEIIVNLEESSEDWTFKIKDTGVGIAKKDFNIVLEDFQRSTDPFVLSTKGAGLGLPLAKRLINLHGGEIKFESIYGKGSTFSFNIPKKKLN